MNVQSRRQMRIFGCWMVVCSMAWLVGCGSRGPKYPSTQLEGVVTVNNQPLSQGSLQFVPQGVNQGTIVTGVIKDGRYTAAKVPLGNVLVLFNAVRKTHPLPSKEPGYPKWATENLIPSQSRAGVGIKVTAGQSVQDFTL